MSVFVIGDVHGCTLELSNLLRVIKPSQNDSVIFLGDLIDKGPDSAGTVRLARQISNEFSSTLIMGNHEENFLRWIEKDNESRERMKRHEDFVILEKELNPDDVDYLFGSRLWLRFSCSGEDWIAVHGGIPATMDEISMYETSAGGPTKAELMNFSSKQRKRIGQVLRLRYQTPDGKFVSLGNETEQDKFWAETYDGRFGHALFGHQPVSVPYSFKNAIALDTGCVFGGELTALFISCADPVTLQVSAEKVWKENNFPIIY